MIAKLKNIFNNNRYYVLGVYLKDGISKYQLIQVFYENNELKIEERYSSIVLDDTFKDFFKKDYPVILHFEGDNIINKIVENKQGYRNNIIFKANPDDFYFFEFYQKKEVFLSVVRKSVIENLIKQISDLNRYIIHVSFGPFVLVNLLTLIKDYPKISTPNYTLEINSNEIVSFTNKKPSQEKYIINGDEITENELPLIATFLNYKYPNEVVEFDTSFLNENKSEFKFKRAFKITSIFTLVFFLIALFVSSELLKTYLSKLTEKQSTYALSQETVNEISLLKEEKFLKEKILETSGVVHKSFITKYIADIGNSVLHNIELKTIDVIPLLKKIRPSEKLNFDFNTISVSGSTSDDNQFNNWVKTLKSLSWIKKLEITDYLQESRSINSFVIKIKI